MGFGSSSKAGAGAPPSYDTSQALAPAAPGIPTFACIILSRRDRLRLCGFPPSIQPTVNEAIQRVWIPGIQHQGPHQGCYEWKLSGNPWSGQGSEAVPARRLIVHVLHALAAVGWALHASCDLSKKGWDKDTLFFKSSPPVQRYFFAISFNESDKIRLIDSPNLETLQAFMAAVRTWPAGIQDSKEKEPNCFQMKLKGYPWYSSNGNEIAFSRMLLCTILGAMESRGFELVGSVDMSIGQGDDGSDLDTWFLASKI